MTTPDAAAIIAAHYRKEAGRDHVDGVWVWLARCDCDWVGTADEYPHHVVDMLAEAGIGPVGEAKAEAWHEGRAENQALWEAARPEIERRTLLEAAHAADATGVPEQGPVYVSSDWLRDRAARIEAQP